MTSPDKLITRTGGQLLVDALKVHGVDMAFGVPGESYLSVLDAFYESREQIKFVICRQEGGAANMADAYGKMTGRLIGPPRDAALEAAMRDLDLPVLVLFGTHDRIIVPEMGRHYKEILPNCHLSFVYEAGHAIGAERPEAYADLIEDFLTRREALVIPNRETALFP